MTDAPTKPSSDTKAGDKAAEDKSQQGNENTDTSKEKKTQSVDPKIADQLKTLPADQLSAVLENPELFNLPRIKELRDGAAKAKELEEAQSKAEEENLTKNKKFEDLANKRGEEVNTLKSQLKTNKINQALTIKLAGQGVVDLDAALKLVNRDSLEVAEDGSVKGVDEALESLKKDRAYLFTSSGSSKVGTATNPSNGQETGGQTRFKRSQITPKFYQENKEEIDKAHAAGQIEDDGPAPVQ